jgi:PAS domain S-box-containing protein
MTITYSTTIDYKNLIENIAAPIYACDPHGIITLYNDAAEILWGYKPEVGKDIWHSHLKLFYPDGRPLNPADSPMGIALGEGKSVQGVEIVIETPDGKRLNIIPFPQPMFDKNGVLSGAINILVNITKQKETEHSLRKNEKQLSESIKNHITSSKTELRDSEERYHKMIEEVKDYAILLLDIDGNILNWNKGAENIKGYNSEEIIGKNFRLFYLEEDRNDKLPEKLIAEAHNKGKATHEGWRLRKDGTHFWGSIVITAIHEGDRIIGYSKVTRDLTERKHSEDQIKQYLKELEFQNKELEQFAYIASHDLQEPLRKIQIFADLAERNIDDKSEVQHRIAKIKTSANRMVTLIKDVLQYSRLTKDQDLFTSVDLNTSLSLVMEDFELLIQEKNAKLNINSLPVVKGIPIQLEQLFSNLLSNSLKFSSTNSVIEIKSELATKKEISSYPELNTLRKYYKLTFSDNGVGFDQQYAEQIFKLFRRLDESSYGAGIGLALCKKIVENHNGHIHVTSKRDQGTEFTVLLPS